MFTETFVPHANGVTTSILNARRGLSERGHKVTVYSAGTPVLAHENVHYYGGKVFPLYPDFPIALFPSRLGRQNKRILEQEGADLIHIHAPGPMGLRGYRASRRQEIPFLVTYHTVYEPLVRYAPFGWKTIYRVGSKAVDRKLNRRCAVLIAPTHQAKRDLVQQDPELEDKIHVVPTGIDLSVFQPGLDGTPVRQKWGFTQNERVLLYLGRNAFEKRIDILLRAFDQLRKTHPDLRLVIAGTGPAAAEHYRIAQSLGLNGSVRFMGHVPDEEVPLYYNACDVFACASDIETQGLTLLEAMATGTPCAVAGARGYLDLVQDGDNAYLFPSNSVDGAAHAIELALSAPPRIRQRARETALQFGIDQCVLLLERAYQKAMDRSSNGH